MDDNNVVPMPIISKSDRAALASMMQQIDTAFDAFLNALNGNTGIFQRDGFVVTVERQKDDSAPPQGED